MPGPRWGLLAALMMGMSLPVAAASGMLSSGSFARHVEHFNTMEDEPVVNEVPNSGAWAWMLEAGVPLFECADPQVEEMYWYRWWALRKHLRRDQASGRFAFTEFITRARYVSSALGHQLMDGRWLANQRWHDDTVHYWLHGREGGGPQDHLHKYSQWLQFAFWQRWLVTQDTPTLVALLDDLVADYRAFGRPST
jgi:hypothetical protein